jgi:hypothetical protein
MDIRNLFNPQRARLQRLLIVTLIVFVGLLVSETLWVGANIVVMAVLGAAWAAIGILVVNYFQEGKPW